MKVITGDSVLQVGDSAFEFCRSLQAADIPEITQIGDFAFKYCESLQTIDFPKVTQIGDSAFSGCRSLQAIDFPKVTQIGDSAFLDCGSLQTTDLPKVTQIGDFAFKGCESLQTIDFPKVTQIGDSAFSGCRSLQAIDFPKVTQVGDFAFKYCESLQTIDFPNVTQINNSAFSGCRSLQAIDFPKVTQIGDFAFKYCESLQTIDFPNVTQINNSAFEGCFRLTSANIPSIINLGICAFSNCSLLESVKLQPDNVERISKIDFESNIFRGCSKLKNIVISTNTLFVTDAMTKEHITLLNREAIKKVVIDLDYISEKSSHKLLFPRMFSGCVGINTVVLYGGPFLKKNENILQKDTISSSAFFGCNGITDVWVNKRPYLLIKFKENLSHQKTRNFILHSFLHLKGCPATLHIVDNDKREINEKHLDEEYIKITNPENDNCNLI